MQKKIQSPRSLKQAFSRLKASNYCLSVVIARLPSPCSQAFPAPIFFFVFLFFCFFFSWGRPRRIKTGDGEGLGTRLDCYQQLGGYDVNKTCSSMHGIFHGVLPKPFKCIIPPV